jgi:hypothetical protein
MEHDITKETLMTLGFDEKRAEELSKKGISTKTIIGNNHIVIDGKENKVYSERAGARKYYFESGGLKFPTHYDGLIEEYYKLKEAMFLEKYKQSIYTQDILKKQFWKKEVEEAERNINRIKAEYPMLIKAGNFSTDKEGIYLLWLKDKQIQKSEVVKLAEQEHPKHDPNLWDIDCYELFKYLYDNYYNKKTKRQLSNIWHYLFDSKSSKYILKATQPKYIEFILENYNVEITNFDKYMAKWERLDCKTINEHRMNFEDTLK